MTLKKLTISRTIPEDEELIRTPLIVSSNASYDYDNCIPEQMIEVQYDPVEQSSSLKLFLLVLLAILLMGGIIILLLFSVQVLHV